MFRYTQLLNFSILILITLCFVSAQPPGGFGPGCPPYNSAGCSTTTTTSSSSSTASSITSTSTLVTSSPSSALTQSTTSPFSGDDPSFGGSSLTPTGTAASVLSTSVSSDESRTRSSSSSIESSPNSSSGSGSGSSSSPYGSYGDPSSSSGSGSSSPSNAGSSPANGGFSFSSLPIFSKLSSVLTAHAVLACLAWAFFFPLGGILIRVLRSRHLVWLHATLQIFSYAMFTAAVGLGIWLVQQFDDYSSGIWHDPHVVIGLLVFGLVFFMPVLGLVHHHIFKTRGVGRRTGWAYIHVWLGRALITLGIINGGLGLRLASKGPMLSADTARKAEIAYGIVAGLVWLLYVVIMAWAELPRKGSRSAAGAAPNGGNTDMWVRTSYREGNERKSIDGL